MSTRATPEQIDQALGLRFESNIGDVTLRQWLIALLAALWEQGEGFSGKRPFGDSGWDWEPAPALIGAGLISGRVDDHGYVAEVDMGELHRFVADVIESMATMRLDGRHPGDWIPADVARDRLHREIAARYKIPPGLVGDWTRAWADSPESEEMGLAEWAIRRALGDQARHE